MKVVYLAVKSHWIILVTLLGVLGIPLQNANAQGPQSPCKLLTSDGSWSEPIKMDFASCANTVFVANSILHTDNTYGIWGQTAINVDTKGDVQTALSDSMSQIDWDSLDWTDWGNLADARSQSSDPQQSPDPTETPVPEPLTLDEIFELAKADINDYWTGVFANESVDYSEPDIVVYNTSKVKTRCGTAPSNIGPFYCPKDNTAYFPRVFMADQHDRIGDYSVVVVIAHEWGHSIQAQLGNETGISIQRELQADCYAGAYSRYAVNDSEKVIIEDGDIDEATASLFEAGDSDGSWFDKNAHGSGEQRQDSFNKGLENGFDAC